MVATENIDGFIKYYGTIFAQNPDFAITSNTIYTGLSTYGLKDDELADRDISDKTDNLQNSFRNAKHLKVFYTDLQPGFLQFSSGGRDSSKCFKMYFACPKEFIEYASYRIFDFIDKNNMDCFSKVAKKVRSDAIVIRIPNPDDALKVINFINNDRGLKKIARDTNPFSYKIGNVAVAYDDLLSYNSIVAEILSNYFVELRRMNKLESASVESFSSFLNQYYQDVFVNYSKLTQYTDGDNYQGLLGRFDTQGEALVNHEQIVRLFSGVINEAVRRKQENAPIFDKNYDRKDINFLFKFYEGCLDEKKNLAIATQFDRAYVASRTPKASETTRLDTTIQSPNVDYVQLLKDYVIYAVTKYGTIHKASGYLQTYCNGHIIGITNDNNFRDRFMQVDRNMIISLIGNDVESFIARTVEEKMAMDQAQQYQQPVQAQQQLSANGYKAFYDMATDLYNRFGMSQLLISLKKGNQGAFEYTPRGQELAKILSPGDIERYCYIYLKDSGYPVDNSMDLIVDFACELEKRIKFEREQNKQY